MASFVNAADAIAAAVEIEKRGHAFYVAAAEKAVAPEDKEFFSFMAGEELRHESIFESMLTRIGGLPLPAGSTDEEYLSYVGMLLDSHALFIPSQQDSLLNSPLQTAMQFEKDTLLFFLAIEKMVPAAEQHWVADCANEERKHMQMIAKRMNPAA